MPTILPIRDLKNTAEISKLCHESSEPIFITKNGYGDMVIMSLETYEARYNIEKDPFLNKEDDAKTLLGDVVKQLKRTCRPEKILLFGSRARGNYREDSDIDLCVIAPTENKRKTLAEMYIKVESSLPIDFLLYTPEEWERNVADSTSFAHQIHEEGVVLYG